LLDLVTFEETLHSLSIVCPSSFSHTF